MVFWGLVKHPRDAVGKMLCCCRPTLLLQALLQYHCTPNAVAFWTCCPLS